MSRIISIGTAIPEHGMEQTAILEFMHTAYADNTALRKLDILFGNSGIQTRHSVVPDFERSTDHHLFNGHIPEIEERLSLFKNKAVPLALEAAHQSLSNLKTIISQADITHLITVSCTGLYAPGLDAEILEQLNLPKDIFHTSVNFLGCNAAFPALKIADMITKTDKDARVLVVSVELCTIHFQAKNNHDNLLSNTIFSDGAAAAIVVADEYADENHLRGFSIHGFYSLLLSKGKHLMGWNVTPVNFEMILDAAIPKLIGEVVKDLIVKAGNKLRIDPSKISRWAIHPGGKRILDTIKEKLELFDNALQYSYNVLSRYGNMSSSTILFVLKEIMETNLQPDETIFAMGFGPGLSVDTSILLYAG